MMRWRHLTFRGCGKFVVEEAQFDDVSVTLTPTENVLALARGGGEFADRFGQFCQEFLCMESWNFIVHAVRFETVRT